MRGEGLTPLLLRCTAILYFPAQGSMCNSLDSCQPMLLAAGVCKQLTMMGRKLTRIGGSMVGSDRLNVPAIDNSSH